MSVKFKTVSSEASGKFAFGVVLACSCQSYRFYSVCMFRVYESVRLFPQALCCGDCK